MQKLIIRLFIGMLIFIGGVSYGSIEEEKSIIKNETEMHDEMEVSETYPVIEVDEKENKLMEQQDRDDSESVIHTTAALFGKVVSSLYEVGVGFIYQFVNLFFDWNDVNV